MTRLTIDLPDDVARDLESRAREAGKSPQEYAAGEISAALEQHRLDVARLHDLIREGDESGEPIPVDDRFLERMKQELRQRAKVDAPVPGVQAKAS